MNRILLINLGGVGDLVMASTAIRVLRDKFPQAEIDILVLSKVEDIVKNCPYIDRYFLLFLGYPLSNMCRNIATLIKLRKFHFDLAINLHRIYTLRGSLKIFLFLQIIKAKKALGRDTGGKGFFYDFKIKDSVGSARHQIDSMLEIVGFLEADANDKRLEVWCHSEKIDDFLKENNLTPHEPIIGIHPGANRQSRRWPQDRFARVADKLIERFGAKIVITGSRDELGLAKEIAGLMKNPVVISSGRFLLVELFSFLRMCKLYITNDTGPMHLADFLNIPMVVIAGSDNSSLPYNKKDNCIILKKNFSCSPCFKNYCRKLSCLKAVTLDEVLLAAEKLLR